MTASIDGQAFSADQFSQANVTTSQPGIYTITGSRLLSGSTAQTLLLTLYNIGATGTYPLGVTGTNFGGTGAIAEGSTTWITPLTGAAGTVTVSKLSATSIGGTFSFVAADLLNSASTRTVTNGSFDLAITGTPGTVQPNQGSSMSATIAGASWSSAVVIAPSGTGGVYSFSGSNVTSAGGYNLFFALSSVTGPGTYALSNTGSPQIMSAQLGGSAQGWSSQLASPPVGSVVITSLTGGRMKGTFSATLPSGGSAAALTITNGTFDIGLP